MVLVAREVCGVMGAEILTTLAEGGAVDTTKVKTCQALEAVRPKAEMYVAPMSIT